MEKVRILFVLSDNCKDETEMSDLMLEAFESCKQVVNNVEWIREGDLNSTDLSKTDFVIFEEFKGRDFKQLEESKCARIVGPRCVSVCLMDGRPIPNFPWPIYNVAMVDCVVACSNFPKKRKIEIREKVQLMGGCYTDGLTTTNTHLVTDTVKSEKYMQAAEIGSNLMLSEWINEVWEDSQNSNIHATNPKFNKYRCLPFHNLIICSTGITNKDQRQELSSLVAQNGGTFAGNLNLATTDILIVHGSSGTTSEKYKAARVTPNIKCVTLDWVTDSIAKGYALPCSSYVVKNVMVSTPTKSDNTNPDFSMVSCIAAPNLRPSTIEETVAGISPFKAAAAASAAAPLSELSTIIDGLDVKKAKKAGPFLDGCSVYLAGFDTEQKEKLTKILNLSGATRYEEICDRLTHIIVGDTSSPEVKIAKARNYPACLVSVQWLIQCIEKQQPVEEENYLINLHTSDKENINSPLTKAGLSMLRFGKVSSQDPIAGTSKKIVAPQPESDAFIIEHYFNSQTKCEDSDTLAKILKEADNNFSAKLSDKYLPNATYSQSTDTNLSSQTSGIFDRLNFVLINFDNNYYEYIQEHIEANGGNVLSKSYTGIPDYVISAAFITVGIKHAANEVVNDLWVLESLQDDALITDIKYYHRPHVIKFTDPLVDCVIVISNYTAFERVFLKNLISALGGVHQEQLGRITRPDKNILASTHLISLEASGKKYVAALKWNISVVDKDWLLECAKTGMLVSEENFLVGEAKARKSNVNTASRAETPTRSSNVGLPSLGEKRPINETVNASPAHGSRETPNKSGGFAQPQLTLIHEPLKTPRNNNEIDDQNVTRANISVHETPKQDCDMQPPENFLTPKGKFFDTPERLSQITPVNKIMQQVRQNHKIGSAPNTPEVKTWFNIDTPETPIGAFIRPNPSPSLRKRIQRGLNHFPDYVSPKKRRNSTPLSELKRRLYNKIRSGVDEPTNTAGDNDDTGTVNENDAPQTSQVSRMDEHPCIEESGLKSVSENLCKQLEELENAVMSYNVPRRSSARFNVPDNVETASVAGSVDTKESQPFTVGWDYSEDVHAKPENTRPQSRIFILSGIDNNLRTTLVTKLESLGATVSDLANYDPVCTHLLSPKPARNEKILACMAAGKWILHTSYVAKSIAAGTFLDEEEFEFGNPKSRSNIDTSNFDVDNKNRVQAMHWWRKEISKRGYGAFHDMKALVIANKREPIVRVIEAGGGTVIDTKPPFDGNLEITHCLLEPRAVTDYSLYVPLAQRGIYCVNTLYISEFLHRTTKDIIDCILPHYTKYYKGKLSS